MFATLSGGLRRPGDSLEIEFLFDRAVRGQTTKRFSEPPQIEHDGQDAALQPRGRPRCVRFSPGNRVRISELGLIRAKESNVSHAIVR